LRREGSAGPARRKVYVREARRHEQTAGGGRRGREVVGRRGCGEGVEKCRRKHALVEGLPQLRTRTGRRRGGRVVGG